MTRLMAPNNALAADADQRILAAAKKNVDDLRRDVRRERLKLRESALAALEKSPTMEAKLDAAKQELRRLRLEWAETVKREPWRRMVWSEREGAAVEFIPPELFDQEAVVSSLASKLESARL